jgi:signal peptidase II
MDDSSVDDSGVEDGGTDESGTRSRRSLTIALSALAGFVYVLDQVTKLAAVAYLDPGRAVPLVDGVLQLRLIRNPGAAFGMATGLTWLLTLVALVVVVVVVRVARRLGSRGWTLALGLLLGGALGNLTDRLLREPGFARGHVVDFLELPRWPVFNVADSSIVAAAVLIGVLGLRGIAVDGTRAAEPAQHSADRG